MCSRPSIPPSIHERAVFGQVLDHSGQRRSFFQMLQRLAALFRLLFFQQVLARYHDIAALLVQLDDGDFNFLALHAVQIAHGPQVYLRSRQEGARAANFHGQAALDALDDDALDRRLIVIRASQCRPIPAGVAPSGARA